MNMAQPPQSVPMAYTRTAVSLHWMITGLIGVALVMGWVMTDMAVTPLKLKVYNWHKWVGITVLWLAALRILWRTMHAPPAMVPMPAWQRLAALGLHGVLYVLTLALPLSGWVYSNAAGVPIVYLRLLPLPDLVMKNKALADSWREVHETLGWLLVAALVVHLLAALKHHFIDKDDTLPRMLPWLPSRKR
jgi:cytochrome b561